MKLVGTQEPHTHHAKESGLYPEGSGELGRVGGQKRLGQLCISERTPTGQRIEKYRKLSKQNEVRDDSRVAQILRVDQLGIGQKEKGVPGLAPEPS